MILILSAVNWRHKIALKIIDKKAAKQNRQVKVHNLETARNIGIIYDATSRKDEEYVKKLIHFFKEERKKVLSIGFVNTKRLEEMPEQRMSRLYFNKKDLNFWNLPKKTNAAVNQFKEKQFDVLVNLNFSEENIPLIDLFALSKASFKIGALNVINKKYGDFFIDVSDKQSIDYFIIQLKHYLSILNKK